MNFREYIEETEENAKEYIKENFKYINKEDLYDDLFVDDAVTGNGSGSYTFNTLESENNVKDLIFDEKFKDVCNEWSYTIGDLIEQGAESFDVTARCMALSFINIDKIYDEIKERE